MEKTFSIKFSSNFKQLQILDTGHYRTQVDVWFEDQRYSLAMATTIQALKFMDYDPKIMLTHQLQEMEKKLFSGDTFPVQLPLDLFIKLFPMQEALREIEELCRLQPMDNMLNKEYGMEVGLTKR